MAKRSTTRKKSGESGEPAITPLDVEALASIDATAPTIELRKVDELVPYARNSRTHSSDQVTKIARSIRQFGFTNPILINEDGTIIAGHGRTMAAKLLNLQTVPVIVARNWTDAMVRAYVIADNKLALDAGWDEDLLKIELSELGLSDELDLEATGFTVDEMDKLFGRVAADPPQTDPQLGGLVYSIVIRCESEAQQGELLERFDGEGLKAEALIS